MVAAVAVLSMLVIGASQPPAPSPTIGSQPPQQQPAAQETNPTSQDAPIPAALSQQPTQQPNQATAPQNQQTTPNWWIWFTNNGANWTIVFLTFVLAVIGFFQWWATHSANKHNTAIERAYVTMSHRPPGLVIDGVIRNGPNGVPTQNVETTVAVENNGNTPAIVTNVLLHFFISDEPLPGKPPYDETHLRHIWVHCAKGSSFNVWQNFPLSLEALENIREKRNSETLYVIGYADYIDKFDRHHRTGYARRYHPETDNFDLWVNEHGESTGFNERNNLPFVTQPNYNYDRERKKGEGNDWGDPA